MNVLQAPAKVLAIGLPLLSLFTTHPVHADDGPCKNTTSGKYALVIGNSYSGQAEVSGVKDAQLMRKFLCEMEFNVLPVYDGKLGRMRGALHDLAPQIGEAKVVLFFFSGHGIQLNQTNYLLADDSTIDPAHPELTVSLAEVIDALRAAPDDAVKLVFLDACRTSRKLPAAGGKSLEDVPGWHEGLAKPQSVPTGTLFGFAASYNQPAASGKRGELSPYSAALLHSIREPGLEIRKLLSRIHEEVSFRTGLTQLPTDEGSSFIPNPFYLKAPVYIKVRIDEVDTGVYVLLNGEIVRRAHRTEPPVPDSELPLIPLRAGENEIVVMVHKDRVHRNLHSWDVTEGWSYQVTLLQEDGTPLRCSKDGIEEPCFHGHEPVPFKDGPHHGRAFEVARAVLSVNKGNAELSLSPPDNEVWKRELPVWARDQAPLYRETIKNLNLSPEEILKGVIELGGWSPILRPLVVAVAKNFLETGKILNITVADPSRTFVTVWGNKDFRSFVQTCMNQRRQERTRDLTASLTEAFKRDPRPFEGFDRELVECIRDVAANTGSQFTREDLRVWTALEEDRDHNPDAAADDGQPAAVLSSLAAIPQDALVEPQEGEVLIGPLALGHVVQGVPLSVRASLFLSTSTGDDRIQIHARALADLSDLQKKIGALIDTIPLPTDNCARFSADNLVARVWGKEILLEGSIVTLKLKGEAAAWACAEAPPCSKVEWDNWRPKLVLFDCNPPMKTRLGDEQPFEAQIPFSLVVIDPNTVAVRLRDPSVNLGGKLGGVLGGILRIAGIDLNEKLRDALERAVNPDLLKVTFPQELLRLDPVITQAGFFNNSGALALSFEMTAALDDQSLAELVQEARKPPTQ